MTTLKPGDFKIGDRVVDIWYGATGAIVGLPPVPPEIDLYRMYPHGPPWVLVEWDYMGGDHYWVRQSDLKLLVKQ
jgi:hypothetical protein